MDRHWMYGSRITPEYLNGVKEFCRIAVQHQRSTFVEQRLTKARPIFCPCRDCNNVKRWEDIKKIAEHLIIRGFMLDYNIWYWHGEKLIPMSNSSSINDNEAKEREPNGFDNNEAGDNDDIKEDKIDDDDIKEDKIDEMMDGLGAHVERLANGSCAIDPKDVKTLQIVNAILKNLEKNAKGNYSSEDRGIDALNKALGKKDHRGHVKELGRSEIGVSHTQALGKEYRKGKSSSQGGCSIKELESMKATLTQEFEARLDEMVEMKLQEMLEQRVAIKVKAYLANLLPQITGNIAEFERIQQTTTKATQIARVIEVPTKCRLALKDEYNQNLVIVADGTVYPCTGEVTRNLKMKPDHYRVSVDKPYLDYALLDIPVLSFDGVTKLGKAKSSFVQWPIDMVFF